MHPFISKLNITEPPWFVKELGKSYEIVDRNDTVIARVPVHPWDDIKQIKANLAVLAAGPELLAALKEAAFILESKGEPLGEEYFKLINRASPFLPPIQYPRPKR